MFQRQSIQFGDRSNDNICPLESKALSLKRFEMSQDISNGQTILYVGCTVLTLKYFTVRKGKGTGNGSFVRDTSVVNMDNPAVVRFLVIHCVANTNILLFGFALMSVPRCLIQRNYRLCKRSERAEKASKLMSRRLQNWILINQGPKLKNCLWFVEI